MMCVCRYDLYEVVVKVESQYSTAMGVNYAAKGYHYITVSMDELLFEGGQSIRCVSHCFLGRLRSSLSLLQARGQCSLVA